MTTANSTRCSLGIGPGFLPLLALGGLLGYAFSGDIFQGPLRGVFVSFCLGLTWAYLFLQWVEIAAEGIALHKNPLPDDLAINDRQAVKDHVETLTSSQPLVLRVKHLLQAWGLGWNPRQITELAAFQSARETRAAQGGALLALLLLAVSVAFRGDRWLSWGGLIALGLTIFARYILSLRVDEYIEARLLARLPANIPQTAVTAAELADALGKSIDASFKKYVPQPQQAGEAMKNAVDGIVKDVGEEVKRLEKALADSQSTLVDKWMRAAEATTTDLKDIEKALGTIVTDLTGGLSTNAEKLNAMFSGHTRELDKSISEIAAQIGKAGGSMGERLEGVLSGHAEKVAAANAQLAAQLEKITALQRDMEKVLHVQEVVDGAMRTVSASEEFSKTLAGLRSHLEESNKLLREVSKPRTIRLVETEGEVQPG